MSKTAFESVAYHLEKLSQGVVPAKEKPNAFHHGLLRSLFTEHYDLRAQLTAMTAERDGWKKAHEVDGKAASDYEKKLRVERDSLRKLLEERPVPDISTPPEQENRWFSRKYAAWHARVAEALKETK